MTAAEGSSAKLLEGIVGIMAEAIEPAPGYENAVEAVLGESLQYILVADQSAGGAAIDYLQTSGGGRCGFIPVSSVKPLAGSKEAPVAADLRRLIEALRTDASPGDGTDAP